MTFDFWSRGAMLAAALALTGCGERGTPPATSPSSMPAAVPAPIGDSVISGKILFEGKAAAPAALRLDAEPVCKAQHAGGLTSEMLVVNPGGTLRNVFVHVVSGLEGRTFAPPAEPVSLDQIGCQYVPHVFGVQVGQAVRLVNSDSVLHNVHARPSAGKGFNVGMPGRSRPWSVEKSFTVAEVVPIRCDVHPWMVSWAAVSDHPFFSVTGPDGAFALRGLPAGDYTVEAWHETLGTRTQKVSVGAHATASLTFTFKP